MSVVALIGRVGVHTSFLDFGATEQQVLVQDTPFGKSAPLHWMKFDEYTFWVLSRHGEKGYRLSAPFVNDRANIWALKELGVSRILSWSAPGSLDLGIGPGDLVLVDDLIDETRSGPGTFFEGKGIGVIRQNPVFCPDLRSLMADSLKEKHFPWHNGGVYVSVEGPRLETPAEIRKYRLFGGHLIGMNLAPETFLARELEMCYGALCYAVNFAEGLKDRPYRPNVLFEGMATPEDMTRVKAVEEAFPALLLPMLAGAIEKPCTCFCQQSMSRYKDRGDIGPDFRTWIECV